MSQGSALSGPTSGAAEHEAVVPGAEGEAVPRESFVRPLLASDLERVLMPRICVRRPDFGLRELAFHDGEFSAIARANYEASAELGPIHAADLGRHGAAAGLCAAALSQPDAERRFYLARKANYFGRFSVAPYGSPIRVRARVVQLRDRELHAIAEASVSADDGSEQLLARVEVFYSVILATAFARMFAKHRRQTKSYDSLALLVPNHMERRADFAALSVDSVSPELCAGHFDEFPALPAATVMRELSGLAGSLFGAPYWISSAVIEASQPCWAGQPVRFEVSALTDSEAQGEGVRHYACYASSEGRPFGGMALTLARAPG